VAIPIFIPTNSASWSVYHSLSSVSCLKVWVMVIVTSVRWSWLSGIDFHLSDNERCWPSVLCSFRSDQISRSVESDSLRPHEAQHARPPCPSPTPGVHSNSLPSSQWCHPAISSSVVPFSSCPQSLPASESFPMSQLFAWGGQSTGVSALASFLPKNTQD